MKIALVVAGVLLLVIGSWWILQGTGIVPVGMMANHIQYAYLGIVVDLIAIVLLYVAWRRR